MKIVAVNRVPNGLLLETDEGTKLRLLAYRRNIIRLSYTKGEFTENVSPIVTAQAEEVPFAVKEDNAFFTFSVSSDTAAVRIKKSSFALCFLRDGEEVCRLARGGIHLQDTAVTVPHYASDFSTENRLKHLGTDELPGYRFYLTFDFERNEQIYGLGQYGFGVMNRREVPVYLYQMNNFAPVPFFVSSKGYGMLVDTGAYSSFIRDNFGTTFYTDSVDFGDFYFVAGKCMDESIGGYRALTGHVPMMPKWLFGYTQSKEHYHTQEELLDILREYRRRKIPLDQIVQDWAYWKRDTWSDKSFDEERYPDPKAMVDEIHNSHAHVMISVWPNTRGGDSFRELFQKNQLLTDSGTFGDGGVYNVFDEAACDTYWNQLYNGIGKYGFDAWWCDSSEPFEPKYGRFIPADEHKALALEEYKHWFDSRKINLFSFMHSRGIYTRQRKLSEEKRVVNLSRSGYAGQQRYGSIVWSGDIGSSFEELKRQVAEGLSYCASGLPYWTVDIGGFFSAHGSAIFSFTVPYHSNQEPGYRELYTRWIQFGCFLPVFRSHGTNFPREIWQFGEEGGIFYESIRKFIELRYRLMPYIYSTAWQVTKNDETFIRMLAFDYADDPKALEQKDTYLFGRSLLVSPVTDPQYFEEADIPLDVPKTKEVYLPVGNAWYDFWTEKRMNGGQTVTVETPIDSMPIFVKAGTILPTTQAMQYVDEIPDAPYTMNIYPGADAFFTLYEDSGDGYDYERGAFAEYDLRWNDAARVLTVSERRGSFAGMCQARKLIIRVAGGENTEVIYNGEALSIQL